MSLYRQTCGLAKAILKSSLSIPYISLFKKTTQASAAEEHVSPIDEQMKYLARGERLHFSAFLLLHQQQRQVNSKFPNIIQYKPLDAVQFRLVSEADVFIRIMNARLLKVIEIAAGAIASACDPYWLIKKVEHSGSDRSDNLLIQTFSPEIDKITSEFTKHPAIVDLARLNQKLHLSNIDPVRQTLMSMEKEIDKLGFGPSLRTVEILTGRADGQSEQEQQYRQMIMSIISLKNTIATVNEIVFDAFRVGAMVTLNYENTFSFAEGSDAIGHHCKLKFQPDSNASLMLEIGSVVHIALNDEPYQVNGPAEVYERKVQFSQSSGTEIELTLRRYNEWMDPRPCLARFGY